MEYIKEDQILHHEELCPGFIDEEDVKYKPFIRFRKNIRLANSIAMKFSNPRDNALDKEDLLQEAYLGLWISCLRFDDSKGSAFSTYAMPTIKGKILLSLRDTNALKIPREFKDIRAELLKHNFSLPLSDEELDILVSEGKFSRAQLLRYFDTDPISLNQPRGSEEKITLEDMIPSENFDIGMEIEEDIIESIIDKVLTYIKPDHRDLVEEWMYATMEGVRIPQETLSIKYKISQGHVSRIIKSAIDIVKMNSSEIRELFGI